MALGILGARLSPEATPTRRRCQTGEVVTTSWEDVSAICYLLRIIFDAGVDHSVKNVDEEVY